MQPPIGSVIQDFLKRNPETNQLIFAKLTNISQPTISFYVNGKKTPRAKQYQKIIDFIQRYESLDKIEKDRLVTSVNQVPVKVHRWTESAIDCYIINANCRICEIPKLVSPKFKCMMWFTVRELVKCLGDPIKKRKCDKCRNDYRPQDLAVLNEIHNSKYCLWCNKEFKGGK